MTGIPGLDRILGGGLLPRRVYLLQGGPGTGKTVLASQLCIEHARQGHSCLFLSMLSESHTNLLDNLRSFDFYDERLARRIDFVSGYQKYEETGLRGLTNLLRLSLKKTRPAIIVIDSLPDPKAKLASTYGARRFVRDLATACSLMGSTAICIAPPGGTPHEIEAASDGVFHLGRASAELRTARTFEVLKFRGSMSLEGKHVFEITPAGMRMHPRFEALFSAAPPAPIERPRRLRFGAPALDRMLSDGLTSGSSTAVLGAPGSGKTLLGLKFLSEGAERHEPGLYFGFYESPERIEAKAEGIGMPLGRHVREGRIELIWQPALEYNVDALAERLVNAVRRRNVQRVFVDGVDGFQTSAIFSERMSRFFIALTNELRALGATTLLAEETRLGSVGVNAPSELSSIYENILVLRYLEIRSRLLRLFSILKMRESEYDSSVRELRISPRGIDVAESYESAEAALADRERIRGEIAKVAGRSKRSRR